MTESLREGSATTGTPEDRLTRRTVIGAAAAGGAILMGAAASPAAHAADEMDHAAMGHTSGPAPHQKLIDAALHCVNTGDVCTNHCIKQLADGATSLAACLRSVQALIPTCLALSRLAALQSPRLKDFTRIALEICTDCEEECKKHESHHAECKACMESCAACIKECKATIDG